MNTRLDIYVDDAEFAEFMAELRLWRKEVRWCVQRLLQIGQKITLVFRDKTLGLGFQRESNALFYVAKFLPEQYDDLLQQGDYLVGVNQRNVLMEDLNLKDMVSLLQNLPRPTTIHLVRLQQQCGSEGQHELRAIQKLCSDLQARRHALANRVATYELSVLEDNEIKTTLDKQKLYLEFVLRKITSLKRGIDLFKERRRMDKMKMWIEGQLQSGIPRPTPTPTTVSSATYTTRPSVVIFPTRTQPSIVPPSPKAHKGPSSSKNRDLTWLYDFASLDLKWLSQKEQKVHAILMWFEKAMEQDHSARVAKLISEQIVKALLHYWIHVRNHMADATFNTQNAFLDHARQLKHNLTANAQLRADIASERITPEALMTMSKDELAAPERIRERLELQQTAMRSVIFRPTEANILIKTRDGFKEVAVPGIHPEVPEPSLKTPATSSSAETAGDGKSQKQPENSSTSRQPTPAAEHTPAPKPPRSTSQAPSAPPPPRPRQPNPTESSHSAQSPSVSQSQHSRHQQTSSQKRPVPSAGEYVPLKRQRSHEVVTPQEVPKQNSLKRHRSDESLESAPRNLSAPKHPPEQTISQPSQQPSLGGSNLSPEDMELEQTRGFVAAIIDNRKSVIDKMANFVYSRNNILSRAAIAPTVFAKTETINTPGKGSTIRIHIGVYTVESNIKNVSSIADIKANVMTVFEESVDSLYWRFTEILKDYAARGKRPSLILAAEDTAKKFSSQIKFDSASRSGLYICTWRVEGVLVVKQTSTDQFLAQRLGWQGFAEFLESLLLVIQAKDAKASAPKSMTRADLPPILKHSRHSSNNSPQSSGSTNRGVSCFKCSLSHPKGPCPNHPRHESARTPSQPLSSPPGRHYQSKKPCLYYWRGKCRNGENCNYSHDEKDYPADEAIVVADVLPTARLKMSDGPIICATEGCNKPGKMVCPTCKKLGVPAAISSFCSQDCFKAYWPHHKGLHKMFTADDKPKTDKFFGYQFTGPLRPGTISPMKTVPDHIQRPDYWSSGIPVSEQQADKSGKIPVYTPEEIAGIREACRLGREVLDIAGRAIRVGMTTDEIDCIVHEACIERGCYPSPLNYYHFPKSVCTSVNEVICHGIPDSRPLQDGDILNIDVSVYKDGYHGDLNDTFLVGNVDEDGVRLVKNAFDCLATAVAMVKPGTMYRDLGKQISEVAAEQGFSVVKTYCGHGIGKLFHTTPNVPHYAKNKAVGIMKPGHIFTIEPMINMGSWRDSRWPDEWTAVTVDGMRSAQFEHTILVTETGYEILTARENEPVMTWDLSKVQRGL